LLLDAGKERKWKEEKDRKATGRNCSTSLLLKAFAMSREVQTTPAGHAARIRAVALVRSEPLYQGHSNQLAGKNKNSFQFYI